MRVNVCECVCVCGALTGWQKQMTARAQMRAHRCLQHAAHLAAEEVKGLAPPLGHCPREARLDGRDVLVEVVAVEAQPRLEAQAVAGAQAREAHLLSGGSEGEGERGEGLRRLCFAARHHARHKTRSCAHQHPLRNTRAHARMCKHNTQAHQPSKRSTPAARHPPRAAARTSGSATSLSASCFTCELGTLISKPSSPV